ncbi:hypothetical protein M427DRAFT_158105 [Gonapodya prolifera JEL478]|uniref:Uncharacterized protein n=1 Tax=Gonapodya prolifera (strain JEL478) TaxID=1344416 RepID=A0A139A3X7_GONPJ|nr:hypothetical protein M427DRAFT_158105 [Gonapodya prolifera JEL478]|eukprot:KXS11527.1 hypothetical protein M427DRAFT_158105 [Gonapodya prolifera JEL478]
MSSAYPFSDELRLIAENMDNDQVREALALTTGAARSATIAKLNAFKGELETCLVDCASNLKALISRSVQDIPKVGLADPVTVQRAFTDVQHWLKLVSSTLDHTESTLQKARQELDGSSNPPSADPIFISATSISAISNTASPGNNLAPGLISTHETLRYNSAKRNGETSTPAIVFSSSTSQLATPDRRADGSPITTDAFVTPSASSRHQVATKTLQQLFEPNGSPSNLYDHPALAPSPSLHRSGDLFRTTASSFDAGPRATSAGASTKSPTSNTSAAASSSSTVVVPVVERSGPLQPIMLTSNKRKCTAQLRSIHVAEVVCEGLQGKLGDTFGLNSKHTDKEIEAFYNVATYFWQESHKDTIDRIYEYEMKKNDNSVSSWQIDPAKVSDLWELFVEHGIVDEVRNEIRNQVGMFSTASSAQRKKMLDQSRIRDKESHVLYWCPKTDPRSDKNKRTRVAVSGH